MFIYKKSGVGILHGNRVGIYIYIYIYIYGILRYKVS